MWSGAPALEQAGPVLCSAVLPCPSCCQGRCPALLSHPESHTQHTQVSSAGAIKYVITSSSVFSSLDHPEGPGATRATFQRPLLQGSGPELHPGASAQRVFTW